MSLSIGIVGLPNVGKSTLFNALTNLQVAASAYPFCTIDPNIGVVEVPDERVDKLASIVKAQKKVYATVNFVDIAGLVKGASKGEGLGNKFLQHIREVDAIVHVVRFFNDQRVAHIQGKINPKEDISTINLELILADLEMVIKRKNEIKEKSKGKVLKDIDFRLVVLEKVKSFLEKEKPAREVFLTEEEKESLKDLPLLTNKPVFYIANVKEEKVREKPEKIQQELSLKEAIIPLCAKLEMEISRLPRHERKNFLAEYGLEQSGLDKVIKTGYEVLNLISYLTAGEKEIKAWTITRGTKAPEAAGKIHTDFAKGFIKAEVIKWEDLIVCNGWVGAKEKGKVRIEGKEYIVQDGDVIIFKFNV